jgi:hypothetical protein
MRGMKTLGLGVVSFCFFTALLGACGASGNPVSGGDGTGTGTGVIDSGASTNYGDSGTGAQASDSGTSSVTDSGSSPIDSGGGGTTTPDSGGGGTTLDCDLGSATTTIGAIITFIAVNHPASCDSSDPCSGSSCCLDIAAATGGGSLGTGETGICIIDLSALGL